MSLESQPLDRHIRPIDLKKDLAKIANLIEISFSERMDSEGRDYLQHMRLTSRNALYLQYAGTSPETSSYPFHGYVWEENDEVIGNLTLIYLRRAGQRDYFIANVAVHPGYRGRGIARQLTERALRHVSEHNGNSVYLQVDHDNAVAIHIYSVAGFVEIARRTTWRFATRAPSLPSSSPLRVSRVNREDWQQQSLWLNELYPPTIAWNLPFHLNHLEPGFQASFYRLANGILVKNWALHEGKGLHSVLSWEKGPFQSDHLWLATSPIWEEEAILTLLPYARMHIYKPGRVSMNYPAGRSVEAFHRAGMQEALNLIWMEKRMPFTGAS